MRIKELRRDKKETQQELADFLGVSLRTVQNYENGSVTVPNTKLKLIAQHYKISVSEIFLLKDDAENTDLKSLDPNIISNYVVENWDELMKNNLFSANFKARAGEWALRIKQSM